VARAVPTRRTATGRARKDKIMSEHSTRPSHRLGPVRWAAGRSGRPRRYVLAAPVALGVAIWLSTLLPPSAALHDVALFAHLGFLILGFGAVLVVDYVFARWALGRTTLADAVANATRLHPLIWAGLAGLVVSGALLRPDLGSDLTLLKLGFVAVLTLNGLRAMALGRRMSALDGEPPPRLLRWGGLSSAVSQVCWWGAVVIGFLNANR
jgi:hypothetical protein